MQLSIIIYDINGQFQMNICSTGLLMKYLYNARNGNTYPVKVWESYHMQLPEKINVHRKNKTSSSFSKSDMPITFLSLPYRNTFS